MNSEQALNVLKQIAAQYQGTLQDHQTIQEALNVVEGRIAAVTEVGNTSPKAEGTKISVRTTDEVAGDDATGDSKENAEKSTNRIYEDTATTLNEVADVLDTPITDLKK